jgi:hypothetical protein
MAIKYTCLRSKSAQEKRAFNPVSALGAYQQ